MIRVARTVRTHLAPASSVLHNSLRVALGLALAVLLARLLQLDHAFWVVLGTLSVLRSNAGWLQKNEQSRVQVEGHCDERGSEEYNIALGAKRAQAAKDYLVTLGIPGSRIST